MHQTTAIAPVPPGAPIAEEALPALILALGDTVDAVTLIESQFDPIQEQCLAVRQEILDLETDLLALIASRHAAPLTRTDLLGRCGESPSLAVLVVLSAQRLALEAAAEASGTGTPFWDERGQGYAACEMGRNLLATTWFPYRVELLEWAATHTTALRALLERAISALDEYAHDREMDDEVCAACDDLALVKARLGRLDVEAALDER
jgi:hypothetical protein